MSSYDPNYIGYLDGVSNRRMYLRISLRDKDGFTELAISGSAPGTFGQIDMGIDPEDITPAKHLTRDDIVKLWAIWKRWHLNGMNAGCEHQRAMRWSDWLIDPSQPKTQHNMWAWVRYGANEPAPSYQTYGAPWQSHVRGLLSKPCPCCGYRYGTQWLREDLPADVITWLTDKFTISNN